MVVGRERGLGGLCCRSRAVVASFGRLKRITITSIPSDVFTHRINGAQISAPKHWEVGTTSGEVLYASALEIRQRLDTIVGRHNGAAALNDLEPTACSGTDAPFMVNRSACAEMGTKGTVMMVDRKQHVLVHILFHASFQELSFQASSY